MIAELKKNTEAKMKKSLEALKNDLGKVRTGRAHTGLLDHVTVDYYGNQTPINQVAKVSLIDARTIGVAPFEKKLGQAIEKAIRDANLGLNPAAAGDMIRFRRGFGRVASLLSRTSRQARPWSCRTALLAVWALAPVGFPLTAMDSENAPLRTEVRSRAQRSGTAFRHD